MEHRLRGKTQTWRRAAPGGSSRASARSHAPGEAALTGGQHGRRNENQDVPLPSYTREVSGVARPSVYVCGTVCKTVCRTVCRTACRIACLRRGRCTLEGCFRGPLLLICFIFLLLPLPARGNQSWRDQNEVKQHKNIHILHYNIASHIH